MRQRLIFGLWSPRIQAAYDDMGVLDMSKADLEALMNQDEEIAGRLDAEETDRKQEVADVIASAAS